MKRILEPYNGKDKYKIVDVLTGEVVGRYRLKMTAIETRKRLQTKFKEKELEIKDGGAESSALESMKDN